MSDIKYLGVQGLEELIILTKNNLAKKADVLQFDVMPDPTKYIGKIVQYVGVSDTSFTRSHFYHSNGIKWTEENTTGEPPKIEMVTILPSWVDSDPQVLYILKNAADITMSFYVKNPSVNGEWFTVEKSASFVVVASLPQWTDADSNIIYFKANGNDLVGYIKNTSAIDAWYTFGEKPQIIIDDDLSAFSENPVQNKIIFTEVNGLRAQANMILTASQDADKKLRADIEANSIELSTLAARVNSLRTNINGLHDDITASQDADKKLRADIEANSSTLSSLSTEISGIHDDITASQNVDQILRADINGLHDDITASQDADKKLRADIEANSSTLSSLSTEISGIHDDISGIHDDITASQKVDQILRADINAIKQKLVTESVIHRYVENQNLLDDFENITISGSESAPTRMEYDGYVTIISHGVQLYINGVNVIDNVPNTYTVRVAATVFVAKNDDLYLTVGASSGSEMKARFYKQRDYSNRPRKA